MVIFHSYVSLPEGIIELNGRCSIMELTGEEVKFLPEVWHWKAKPSLNEMPLRGHWKKHSFPNVQNHLTSKIRTCFIQSPYRDLLLICWVFPENSKSLKIPNGRFAEGKLRSSTWPSYWICGRPPGIQRTIPIGCAERAKLCGLLQGIARQPLKRGRYGEDEKRCSNFWAPDVRSILIFYIYIYIFGENLWENGPDAVGWQLDQSGLHCLCHAEPCQTLMDSRLPIQ